MSTEARLMMSAASDAERAAIRLERAAEEANRAADRMESVLHQLTQLVGHGYGNNVERFIEAAEKLQFTEPPTHSTT